MLVRIYIALFILFAAKNLLAQETSFIGLSKNEVQTLMKKEFRSYSIDKSVVRQNYNYLKYVNGIHTVTWIFYFTKDDICRSAKKICDYVLYDEMLDELDKKYLTVSQNQWEYQDPANNTFVITMKEEEWYFTLRESRKEQ